MLLYGEPVNQPVTFENITDEPASCFSQSQNRIKEFMAGAALYLLRHQNRLAAFLLHQAAEQALLYIFKKATGLQLITHNIDKMLRCCTLVNSRIQSIFPTHSEADERLLKLLRKAYIDARYNDAFTMNAVDIVLLTERIKRLEEEMGREK
jgi:HEPN domain-containing protein